MSKQIIPFLSFLFLIITGSTFTSCAPDEEITVMEADEEFLPIGEFPGVDPVLWSYFSSFEAEAAARGLDIDLYAANITGVIAEIDEEHVAGQCTFSSAAPNAVTIDKTFWDNSSVNFREFVVFHELGHCFLGRGHEESVNGDGTCSSIMRSGAEDCQDNYQPSTRKAYLDELFEQVTL